MNEAQDVLSGWKEIAKYLGMGLRTVQRYELQLSLPIRRPAVKSCGLVVAFKEELDAWVNSRPLLESSRLRQRQPDDSRVSGLKNVLAEQHGLREEMKWLREETYAAVTLLGESIRCIQAQEIGQFKPASSLLHCWRGPSDGIAEKE